MDYGKYLEIAKKAAKEAGQRILDIYESENFDFEIKGDKSPLTKADKASHEIITSTLASTGLPLLSEEGRDIPHTERSNWELFWMIDPVDGTKEFIKRNGEFTVNIALIHNNRPVLGIVFIPVTGDIFWAVKGYGAFKNGKEIHVSSMKRDEPGLLVVASRSHLNVETKQFISSLQDPRLVYRGSSLKLLMVAEGEADIYPRFAPTMEWDTAAAHAIATESGASVVDIQGNELVYNKLNLLNPFFIVSKKN